jgi:hypothetical protein
MAKLNLRVKFAPLILSLVATVGMYFVSTTTLCGLECTSITNRGFPFSYLTRGNLWGISTVNPAALLGDIILWYVLFAILIFATNKFHLGLQPNQK